MVDSSNNTQKNLFTVLPDKLPLNIPPPRVLVVDDDDDNRLMLKLLLEMWKYEVIEAADGIEVVDIAEMVLPDLILLDVKMPKMNGFDVTEKIRQSPLIGNVPVVFVSGCVEPVYQQRASAVGGNEYLIKPLNFQELEFVLEKYIQFSGANICDTR